MEYPVAKFKIWWNDALKGIPLHQKKKLNTSYGQAHCRTPQHWEQVWYLM